MNEGIQELTKLLPDDVREYCDDYMARRYLRATSGNVAKAVQRIQDSVKWRKEIKPETVVCKACRKDPGSHYMNVVGFCKMQRPVFYSCMKLSRNKDVEDGKNHLINRFEQAIRMMPEGTEQWIWVCDFFGFGVSDMSPAMARKFVDLTANHYPERLGAYLLVDTPYIFEGLWKLVKPWLDPVTVQKIVFVPYDLKKGTNGSVLSKKLHELFPPELAEWLVEEIRDNRKVEQQRNKKSIPDSNIYKDALTGSLKPLTFHDIRGTLSVLEKYNEDPSLLLPQAEVGV